MQLDIMGALKYGIISMIRHFTIVGVVEEMGTLIGLSRKARLMDDKGHIENLDKALVTDSVGTVVSSFLGTSTVTSYVESAAGISQGGRTGLTALTVAVLFAASLVFAPLIGLVPAFATAPALLIVGALMMMEVMNIDFNDFTEGFPAFMTIIMMPLTYSIASGFGVRLRQLRRREAPFRPCPRSEPLHVDHHRHVRHQLRHAELGTFYKRLYWRGRGGNFLERVSPSLFKDCQNPPAKPGA